MIIVDNNPLAPCFALVFDREGYSPAMMLHLKEMHIACLTYHNQSVITNLL